MIQPQSPPIPLDFSRAILINPTRYLGNLLIAGGLIQSFHQHCARLGKQFHLVIDDAFRELVEGALPPESLLFYPRRQIAQAKGLSKAVPYLLTLRAIRSQRGALAFNIEEDSVSQRLTQLSGARFRLGCGNSKSRWGYEHFLAMEFSTRPEGKQHRWHAYAEIFAALGMPLAGLNPEYMRLSPPGLKPDLLASLKMSGVEAEQQLVVLHAGATKEYKQWPEAHFADLALLLEDVGVQPLFIGAGADLEITARIMEKIDRLRPGSRVRNLCGKFSLGQLAAFLAGHATAMVGNDSGPSHLASALEIPGVVIFGPTETALWAPLSAGSRIIQQRQDCAPDCSRQQCSLKRRCLSNIAPTTVMEQLMPMLARESGQ